MKAGTVAARDLAALVYIGIGIGCTVAGAIVALIEVGRLALYLARHIR